MKEVQRRNSSNNFTNLFNQKMGNNFSNLNNLK